MQNSRFKLGKLVLLLFLFQIAAAIFAVLLMYVLTDLLHLLLRPLSSHSNVGMIGMMCGSLYFGQFMEKRNPGVLDRDKIKKLSLVTTIVQVIFGMFVVYPLLYSDPAVRELMDAHVLSTSAVALGILILITILNYFIVKYCIGRGVRMKQHKLKCIGKA